MKHPMKTLCLAVRHLQEGLEPSSGDHVEIDAKEWQELVELAEESMKYILRVERAHDGRPANVLDPLAEKLLSAARKDLGEGKPAGDDQAEAGELDEAPKHEAGKHHKETHKHPHKATSHKKGGS